MKRFVIFLLVISLLAPSTCLGQFSNSYFEVSKEENVDESIPDDIYGKAVVGQQAIAGGIATYEATKALIGAITILVIYRYGDVIVDSLYIPAEYVSSVIDDVMSNSITISQSTSKADRKVLTDAVATIKAARKSKDAYYFEAFLVRNGGQILLGSPLTREEAIDRLKLHGEDVFAISQTAASSLAALASPVHQTKWDKKHGFGEDYFPHYHPIGLCSSNPFAGPDAMPHVWYMW